MGKGTALLQTRNLVDNALKVSKMHQLSFITLLNVNYENKTKLYK